MAAYFDEIEIEDMEYDEETETYHYPCPCGDRFEITKEELENGEDEAKCPSCSLIIKVIYDQDMMPVGLVEHRSEGHGEHEPAGITNQVEDVEDVADVSLSTSTLELLNAAVVSLEVEELQNNEDITPLTSSPQKGTAAFAVGSFVSVFVYGAKGEKRLYNGMIQDYALGEYEVKFMEKRGDAYVWPDKDDVSIIPCYDVACVLPAPHLVGRGRYVFN